jgi:hypothetical protein
MKLVVFGKGTEIGLGSLNRLLILMSADSLEGLTKLVVESFKDAQNKSLAPPDFTGSPYGEKELKVSLRTLRF